MIGLGHLAKLGALAHSRAQHVTGRKLDHLEAVQPMNSAWVPLPAPGGPKRS